MEVTDPYVSGEGRPVEWMDDAECRGRESALFFDGGSAHLRAIRICAGCTVRDACLEFALADPELQGVWGGVSEPQRRRMRSGKIPDGS
jgi:WhiB family transcriptional regulator, redox-sensing transcriptional regulator